MGRDLTSDLTKQYASLFGKKGLKTLYSFVNDVYRSGKSREIISFIIWEICHRLGLFPKKSYLVLSQHAALGLSNEKLASLELHEKINQLFEDFGLRATRAVHNWKLLYIKNPATIFGCLYPNDCELYKSTDNGASVVFVHRFPERIKSIYVSTQETIFVCIKGAVYRSCDGGALFEKVLELGSTESFFRFNNAMTETPDQTLVLGEYGNIWDKDGWRKLAFLYFSKDGGATWQKSDFLIDAGTNKHVHIVKYSQLWNKLLVADGDNYKRLWLSDSLDNFDWENPKWHSATRFHIQMGGYTSVVENEGKIFFGTDYQGGTNFLVESSDGKRFSKTVIPDPYRRSPIDNMVLRKSKRGNEIWANLPFSTANTKCLLMYSADNGKNWNKVFEYSSATHMVWLISTAYQPTDELYISLENKQSHERVVYKIGDK